MSKPRILVLDIETAPAVVYVWSLFDSFVPIERIIRPTRMICWSAKWIGDKEVHFGAEWQPESARWLGKLHDLMSSADAILTQNGDKFDLPRIAGTFVLANLAPTPPVASIDVLKTTRKLGFTSSKLGFVGPLLKVGAKLKHEGFDLWARIEDGDVAARQLMERYNKQDVRLLERVYRKLRPYIRNHPYLGTGDYTGCPQCNSPKVQKRGTRRTKAFIIDRLHCQSCGAWSDGTKHKVGRRVK